MTYPPPPPPPGGGMPPPPMGAPAPAKQSPMPMIAAIIMFAIAALVFLGIAWGVLTSFISLGMNYGAGSYTSGFLGGMIGLVINAICWIIKGALAIFAIIGGVMALGRKKWVLALVGAICATLTFTGPCCVGPFLLGIVAIVLVAISKKEFKS